MSYYKELREHIRALEANGKLIRIKREINKDTELMPLVRWQFRGLPESERKAFLFENVVDAQGKKYDIPVLVGSHAASRDIYAIGMMCRPEDIMERWTQAQLHPIEPKLVETGPVHEEVYVGDNLLERGGLDEIPIPISTPGFDNAPYLTAANWVTKDPETGVRNIGNYRGMIKGQLATGIGVMANQHLRIQWEKCLKKGIPLQVAAILGATPNIGFTAVTKLPYGTDEYAVAGGITGEPVEMVKCKTIDLEVPATAEIVLEGISPTDFQEREAPFGEFTGYMGVEHMAPYFQVTAITHRKNPTYNAFISQFPPSESSTIKNVGFEPIYYKFLKYDCGIPGIVDVAFHEMTSTNFGVIVLKKTRPSEALQALNCAVGLSATGCKMVIAVDDDIDPRDLSSVLWAVTYRAQPSRDIRITMGRVPTMDYSAAPPDDAEELKYPKPSGASAVMVDATRKWDYPPVSLPRREFMERARKIWEEEGLPQLSVKMPWFGYSLGYWSKELADEAELALKGEHYQTGEKLARNREDS
jgi:4-hydroxy-3-polyprenylbenzoate decarboxylase